MADTATGTDIILLARRLSDQEGATLRFPDAEVLDYVNAGIASWWDIIIGQRGWQWCGKPYLVPGTVTQTGANPLLVFTGNAVIDANIRVKITAGGNETTALFSSSIDGGNTYQDPQTADPTPTELQETGLSVSFPAGAYTLGNIYSVKPVPPTTFSGQRWYVLPDDFYKMQTVMYKASGWIGPERLSEMERIEEAAYQEDNVPPMGAVMKYTIRKASGRDNRTNTYIGFYPSPGGSDSFRIHYFPEAPLLPTTGDVLLTYNGWGDEYAAYYAAIKMAMKDENFELSDRLKDDLKGIEKDIRSAAANRSADLPHIQNVRAGRRRVAGWWVGR